MIRPVRVLFKDSVLRVLGELKGLGPAGLQGTRELKGLSPSSPHAT